MTDLLWILECVQTDYGIAWDLRLEHADECGCCPGELVKRFEEYPTLEEIEAAMSMRRIVDE